MCNNRGIFCSMSGTGSQKKPTAVFLHIKTDSSTEKMMHEEHAQMSCVKQDYLSLLRLRTLNPQGSMSIT